MAKYGHLMLAGAFPDKEIPDIDFTDQVVGRCDVSVAKIIFQEIAI